MDAGNDRNFRDYAERRSKLTYPYTSGQVHPYHQHSYLSGQAFNTPFPAYFLPPHADPHYQWPLPEYFVPPLSVPTYPNIASQLSTARTDTPYQEIASEASRDTVRNDTTGTSDAKKSQAARNNWLFCSGDGLYPQRFFIRHRLSDLYEIIKSRGGTIESDIKMSSVIIVSSIRADSEKFRQKIIDERGEGDQPILVDLWVRESDRLNCRLNTDPYDIENGAFVSPSCPPHRYTNAEDPPTGLNPSGATSLQPASQQNSTLRVIFREPRNDRRPFADKEKHLAKTIWDDWRRHNKQFRVIDVASELNRLDNGRSVSAWQGLLYRLFPKDIPSVDDHSRRVSESMKQPLSSPGITQVAEDSETSSEKSDSTEYIEDEDIIRSKKWTSYSIDEISSMARFISKYPPNRRAIMSTWRTYQSKHPHRTVLGYHSYYKMKRHYLDSLADKFPKTAKSPGSRPPDTPSNKPHYCRQKNGDTGQTGSGSKRRIRYSDRPTDGGRASKKRVKSEAM